MKNALAFSKASQVFGGKGLNPIQYGLFLKHYGMGGHYAPLVTSLFLKVEGQNLAASGILVCFLQKWH